MNKFDIVGKGDNTQYIEMVDDDGNKVLVHQQLNTEDVKFNQGYKFSKFIGDVIAQKIAEGGILKDICKAPGMPGFSIVYRWMRENSLFNAAIQAAREARAETFADEIYLITQQAAQGVEKDQIPSLKLATDNYKWLAEKNGKQSYGASKNEDGKGESNVQIIVNTGIVRDTENVIEVKSDE